MNTFPVQLSRNERLGGWIYWAVSELAIVNILRLVPAFIPALDSSILLDFLYLAINFLCLTVILWQFLGKSWRFALTCPGYVLRSAFLGYGLYWLLNIAVSYLCLWLMPEFINLNNTAIAGFSQQQRVLTHIATVLLAPVAEELLYRGLLFGCLAEKKRWLGYVVSTVVFSAVHVVGYLGEYSPMGMLVAFIQYLPAGVCLGWAYDRSKCIYAPILMHMAVNQMAMMVM